MTRSHIRLATLLLVAAALTATGCQSDFLSAFELKDPIRMAQVSDSAAELINPFSPYNPLATEMSKAVDQPVRVEPAFPVQASAHLNSGWYGLAVVTPVQYALLQDKEQMRVLALFARPDAEPGRPALLVARVDGDVKTVDDLKDQRVAFGPANHSRDYYAGLALLRANGMNESDLAQDLPGFSALWRHVPKAQTRAQRVLDGETAAAFIDQEDWLALPEQSEAEDEPCRSKLCVIAETIPVPDLMLVASPKLPEETAAKITAFLMGVREKSPTALKSLPYDRFVAPSADVIAGLDALVVKGDDIKPWKEQD